MELY